MRLCAPKEAHIAPHRRVEGASISLSSRVAGSGSREAKKLRRERARGGVFGTPAQNAPLMVRATLLPSSTAPENSVTTAMQQARLKVSARDAHDVAKEFAVGRLSCVGAAARQAKQQERADIVCARRESIGCGED